MSILLAKLVKKFGRTLVLQDVEFSISFGQCFWLVGNNGAGKSTLINILADLVPTDSGSFTIGGLSYENERDALVIKRNLGVLLDKNPAIPELTGCEYLQFLGIMHELGPDEAEQRIQSLVRFFFDDVSDANKRISTYSFGMKKKIGLCAALLHRPQYLLLDEPFASLDPVSGAKLVQFLQSYLTPERAILLSSHDLGYSQQIMTHLGVLDGGRLVFTGSAEEFTSSSAQIEQSILSLLQPASALTPDTEDLAWLLD
jgi:ABC-2 type transport system ATP-binding protein